LYVFKYAPVHVIGQVQLRRHHFRSTVRAAFITTKEDLEMEVWGPAAVPARVNGAKLHPSFGISDLGAAQALAIDDGRCGNIAYAGLAGVAGIQAEGVGLPEIKAGTFQQGTVTLPLYLYIQSQHGALGIFADVLSQQ